MDARKSGLQKLEPNLTQKRHLLLLGLNEESVVKYMNPVTEVFYSQTKHLLNLIYAPKGDATTK